MLRNRILLAVLLSFLTVSLFADKTASEHFNAVAILPASSGPSTVNLQINIRGYSDASTLDAMGQTFEEGNQDALLRKFQSMDGIGDVQREGNVGVQVKLILAQQTAEGGREITMITDRPMRFWEATSGSPTVNYPFGMIKFTVDDKGEGRGQLFPVVKIKSISSRNIAIDDYGVIPIQLTVHQMK